MFPAPVFWHDNRILATLATRFLNGAGAGASVGIIHLERLFSVRTQDFSNSPRLFFRLDESIFCMAIEATTPGEIQK